MTEFTADQIIAGITKALGEGDVEAVDGLLRLLAVTDAEAAQDVYDTLRVGVAFAKEGLL